MRLWLLRQAHPDLSKLELEVSTSCLSKISLLRLLLGQTNRDKDFPESLRYSVFPNMSGVFSLRNTCDYGGANGCVTQTPSTPKDSPAAVNTSLNELIQIMSIDASRNSSLYGASTTVQTASMRTYCLIRYA